LLREYLEQVRAAVAKEALTMILTGADATGFEEDARLTAMWLWTLKAGDGSGTEGEAAEDDSGDEEEGSGKKPQHLPAVGAVVHEPYAQSGFHPPRCQLSDLLPAVGAERRARRVFADSDSRACHARALRRTDA
jgi:hypothetical protein